MEPVGASTNQEEYVYTEPKTSLSQQVNYLGAGLIKLFMVPSQRYIIQGSGDYPLAGLGAEPQFALMRPELEKLSCKSHGVWQERSPKNTKVGL